MIEGGGICDVCDRSEFASHPLVSHCLTTHFLSFNSKIQVLKISLSHDLCSQTSDNDNE